MIPLLLSLALFLFWILVGRALIVLVLPRYPVLKSWLIAPAAGLSITMLGVTWLNQWGTTGIPIKNFATLLLAGLLLPAFAVLLWRRPVFPWKQAGVFLAIATFSLLYTGWPHFQFGFDWISYGNDDMANYCLAASRTVDDGFYRLPTADELSGSDYSQYFWFMHVTGLIRFGSELLLSWVAAASGLNPLFIFMPTILALGLVQICSLAALVLWQGRARRLAYGSSFLLAASPLFGLGIYYQLIAQVGGLALMMATLTLASETLKQRRWQIAWKESFLLALVAFCLCIFYPEVTPFTGLALILYWGLTGVRKGTWLQQLPSLFVGACLTFLFLWENSISFFYTLASQATASYIRTDSPENAFPYFVVPSGAPTLFGWISLGTSTAEPWLSLLIIAAFFLLAAIFFVALFQSWKRLPWACLLLVILLTGIQLFRSSNSAFSLFKLAMFLQPALAVALASLLFFVFRKQIRIALGAYCLLLSFAWYNYGMASLGLNFSGFCQLPRASELGLNRQEFPKNLPVTSDISNIVAIKLSALLSKGHSIQYPSRGNVGYIAGYGVLNGLNPSSPPGLSESAMEPIRIFFRRLHPRLELMKQGDPLARQASETIQNKDSIGGLEFALTSVSPDSIWLVENPSVSLFNKALAPPLPAEKGYFLKRDASDLLNHLVFIESQKGKHYYGGKIGEIAVHQAEKDFFSPSAPFNALGRYFVFQIVNPSRDIWLRLNFTRTLQGGGDTLLPEHAFLQARNKIKIPFVGGGSANLYVGPFQPLSIRGSSYFAVDLGLDGRTFGNPRSGMMKLFGAHVPLDARSITGFGRDFSILSGAEYQALKRPMVLNKFPQQLAAEAGLEYSGLYEDGWISPQAFFILGPGTGQDVLKIRGHLPGVDKFLAEGNQLKVRINGGPEKIYPLQVGNFTVFVPCDEKSAFTRVDIEFERTINLPSPDDRPSGGRLLSAELGPASALAPGNPPPLRLDRFSEQLDGSEDIESAGISQDGWTAKEAFCVLGPSHTGDRVVIKGRLPKTPPFLSGNPAKIRVNRGKTHLQLLSPGDFSIAVPCDNPGKTTRIDLEFDLETPLKTPDTRKSSVRLSSIEIIPNLPLK